MVSHCVLNFIHQITNEAKYFSICSFSIFLMFICLYVVFFVFVLPTAITLFLSFFKDRTYKNVFINEFLIFLIQIFWLNVLKDLLIVFGLAFNSLHDFDE